MTGEKTENSSAFCTFKLFFQGGRSDIFIEALYIYVCMPIFIYIFKEIQVCTDVGLFSANRPLSAFPRGTLTKSMESCQLVQFLNL